MFRTGKQERIGTAAAGRDGLIALPPGQSGRFEKIRKKIPEIMEILQIVIEKKVHYNKHTKKAALSGRRMENR